VSTLSKARFSCLVAGAEGAVPFNTQFFHDDDDDGPGFDDGFDGDIGDIITTEPGEQDLLSETQNRQRRVRPETVNYTKRAKRVDVRKLKENIWRGLDIIVPSKTDEDAMVRLV
jgi:condensin complex subunit 2